MKLSGSEKTVLIPLLSLPLLCPFPFFALPSMISPSSCGIDSAIAAFTACSAAALAAGGRPGVGDVEVEAAVESSGTDARVVEGAISVILAVCNVKKRFDSFDGGQSLGKPSGNNFGLTHEFETLLCFCTTERNI